MRGRKPKPPHLVAVEGGAAAVPAGVEGEVMPPVGVARGLPDMPGHLSQVAAAEWERLAPLLMQAGLLTDIFGGPLACYCQAYGRWVDCENKIAAMGDGALLIRTPNGYPIQNPLIAIANKAMEQMRQWAAEFGMTPASLARAMRAPGEQGDLFGPQGGDDFDGWQRQNAG